MNTAHLASSSRSLHGHASALAIAVLAGTCVAQPCEPMWETLGAGVAGVANDLVVFDDGNGPALYVGGLFTSAGGANANRVARWDGQAWSPLGVGVNNTVIAMTVFDDGGGDALYVGGVFLMAGGNPAVRIAKWDGQTWSPLGAGASSSVQALAVFDDGNGQALYAGGIFLMAGGIEVNRIAKWDGQEWSALGTGVDGTIQDLRVFDDGTGPALYACGFFNAASGVPGTSYIARWNGAEWESVGGGATGVVRAMGEFDDGNGPALYAAMDTPTQPPVTNVVRWDGQSWQPIGSLPTNGSIVSFAVFDDGTGEGPALYAAGTFTNIAGISAARIVRWNGTTWSALGLGASGGGNVVNALMPFDDGGGPALFAAGGFQMAGTLSASRIALWRGCSVTPPCYPDCDTTTGPGVLDIFDFLCFGNRFDANDPYACDCDTSTGPGVCDIFDFLCFGNAFDAGC